MVSAVILSSHLGIHVKRHRAHDVKTRRHPQNRKSYTSLYDVYSFSTLDSAIIFEHCQESVVLRMVPFQNNR